MKVEVRLDPNASSLERAAFASIPELRLTTGAKRFIELDGTRRRITLITISPNTSEAALLMPDPDPNTTGIVVARTLTAAQRESIESAGLSWCDARGAIHLTWPGTYLHIDRGRRTPAIVTREAHSGIGVASIRGVQTILTEPEAGWSVAKLAHAAALSTGQAHNVLTMLEANRMLRTEGRGPKHRRYLDDRDEAMEWLASIERARRRPDGVASYLYARTYEDLIDRFAALADQAKISYALTAAGAAAALGHRVLTNLSVLQVRVGPIDAEQALDLLGLERLDTEGAGRGINLELWTDVGELGTFSAETVDDRTVPVRVAPRVRIWLDMLRQGGRDADAAALFKEQTHV